MYVIILFRVERASYKTGHANKPLGVTSKILLCCYCDSSSSRHATNHSSRGRVSRLPYRYLFALLRAPIIAVPVHSVYSEMGQAKRQYAEGAYITSVPLIHYVAVQARSRIRCNLRLNLGIHVQAQPSTLIQLDILLLHVLPTRLFNPMSKSSSAAAGRLMFTNFIILNCPLAASWRLYRKE